MTYIVEDSQPGLLQELNSQKKLTERKKKRLRAAFAERGK